VKILLPPLKSALLSVLIISMKEKETIYRFFWKLPDIIGKSSAATPGKQEENPASPLPPPAPSRQPDESEAFLEAMKGVKRVDPDKMRIPGAPREGRGHPFRPGHVPEMDEILKDEHSLNVINLPEYMEGYVDDVNPLVMEKLRNGEFSVQRVLDLHGLSAGDAHDAFRDFIREAVQVQVCCVKVIHGRGLKSRSAPVLKEKLKEWIVRAMHRKWVVAFASSKMSAGGPGATTILLRTRAQKKKLHIIG
jgi:DNA-nicking Smr family endonuclease